MNKRFACCFPRKTVSKETSQQQNPMTEDEMQLCSLVFDNELVVSRILSFLPFNELSECRLINQLWLREANSLFYKKAVLKIEPQKVIVTGLIDAGADEGEISKGNQYYAEICTLGFQKYCNFALCLLHSDELHRNEVISLFQKLANQREPFPTKYLKTSFSHHPLDIPCVKNILRLTPNLVELEMKLTTDGYHDYTGDDEIGEPLLPCLKILTISQLRGSDRRVSLILGSIAKNSLQLAVLRIYGASFPKLDLKTLETIVEQDPQQLQEIQLSYAEAEMLQALLKVSASLRVLKIGNMYPKDVVILGGVLKRFAKSLDEIHVGVGFKVGDRQTSVVLPQMQNLRILKFRALEVTRPIYMGPCGNAYMDAARERELAIAQIYDVTLLDYLNISRIFEDGDEEFKRKFPQLVHIELHIDPQLLRCNFNDVFFLKVRKDVKITQVTVFEQDFHESHQQVDQYFRYLQRLVRIFPNVHSLKQKLQGLTSK